MPYVMPPLEKNDAVIWYRDGEVGRHGLPAIAVSMEGDTAMVNVMAPGRTNFECRDCVRHISDPWLESYPHHKKLYGAWDYAPATKRLMQLEELLSKPKGK